jgi:hypothetical protein
MFMLKCVSYSFPFLCGIDKLVSDCFSDLKLESLAGHVPKSRKKYRFVWIRTVSAKFVQFHANRREKKRTLDELPLGINFTLIFCSKY